MGTAADAVCQPGTVTKPPVCVLGLGLIGGSLMRAAAATGREVFGYNRSVEGVQAARFDGFDASEHVDEVLGRAAETSALIVLAVPCPPSGSCWATSATPRRSAR